MSQMFFGQYLLDEQVIGEDALAEAIAHAEETNARIGRLAVERGFMSQSDTHRIQLEQRETDLRFIDLAVDLGLLTREQGSVLLSEQRRRHKPIGQALVELGHLTRGELDDWLDRFHLAQFDLDAAHLELPLELCEEDLAIYLVEYLPRLFRRVTHVPMKLEAGRPWNGRTRLPYRARLRLEGDAPLELGFAGCPELAAQLAAAFAGGPAKAFGSFELHEAVCSFADLLGQAGERSVVGDGLTARVEPSEVEVLPKSGHWFPATTPCGRGILVLEAS